MRRKRLMEIKIKLNEVAKDFDKPSKELVEILNEKFPESPKKAVTALTPEELNFAFEYYTQNNQVENFDKYFAMQPAPKAEQKKEEAPAAEKKEKIPTKKAEETPKTPEKKDVAPAPKAEQKKEKIPTKKADPDVEAALKKKTESNMHPFKKKEKADTKGVWDGYNNIKNIWQWRKSNGKKACTKAWNQVLRQGTDSYAFR